MLTIFYAVITVVSWGVWLAPSHKVPVPNQRLKTFYVSLANVGLATLIFAGQGPRVLQELNLTNFALVFTGGIIWAMGGTCAFTATTYIGTARAFGIWAPLNIVVSSIWGALLFREFVPSDGHALAPLFVAFVAILGGVLLIAFAKGPDEMSSPTERSVVGLFCAIGAGIFWGSYFIPIHYANISLWAGGLPLALGMLLGSGMLVCQSHATFRLQNWEAYARVFATGLLWGIGNYGMLLLVDALGAARGFTIAQLSIVVNALVGIVILKDPQPRTRAATMIFIGCVLATIGGIIVGSFK